jgi:hypothetical protein
MRNATRAGANVSIRKRWEMIVMVGEYHHRAAEAGMIRMEGQAQRCHMRA